jgi:glycine oxidase
MAIALELSRRGAQVTVVDHGRSFAGASTAAAGMLASEDPYNPPALLPLARLSADRYPAFLRRIEELSGHAVPYQTQTTVQYLADGTTVRLAEQSIDPRQLGAALYAAVKATPIRLLEETAIVAVGEHAGGVQVHLADGKTIAADVILYAAGAWTARLMATLHGEASAITPCITPSKGQMLRVRMPPASTLHEVHRSEHIYIVPRTRGPQAGTALIGATVEDAGFDTAVHTRDLDDLRERAAMLLPEFASKTAAPLVEAWAGLRPATPDALPFLGACAGRHTFLAGGHYRNGILLAPATALVMADLLEGKPSALDLSAFSPTRFAGL